MIEHHDLPPDLTASERVPRLAHIVWLFNQPKNFTFAHVITFLSIQLYFKPEEIIIWYSNSTPVGPWWEFTKLRVPNIELIQIDVPRKVYGRSIELVQHQSDIVRIEVLIQLGGLYVDLDVVLLKPLTPLLRYNLTQGAESQNRLGSGFILAAKNTTFLRIWHGQYRTFDDSDYNGHAIRLPMELAQSKVNPKHDPIIHINWLHIQRPNWEEKRWLFEVGKLWDWRQNYAIHFWSKGRKQIDYNPDNIRTLNSTLGEVFRHIYYGNSDILPAVTMNNIENREEQYLI